MRDRTPIGTIEGASRYSRARHLVPSDILVEGEQVDYRLEDTPTITRRSAPARPDAAVQRYRDVILGEAPEVGLDVADRCARQLVQVLVAEGRL